MASFLVEGGTRLLGEITPQGAKNEALQVISAVLLTDETVHIHNVPEIRDVKSLIELLIDFGVEVEKTNINAYKFTARNVDLDYLETDQFLKKAATLRGSIMLLGPLLGRFGIGKMSKPGGDKIGRRRVDTHFVGFEKLGATFHYDGSAGFYTVDGKHLTGDLHAFG